MIRRFWRKQIACLMLCVLVWAGSMAIVGYAQGSNAIVFKISDRAIAPVNDRLFGHLLERASWGEPGPEIALQRGTRSLYPEAVELMQQMNIPLIRFPGGTDVDYTNWQDLISNVPDRDVGRPLTVGHTGQTITNQFGLDEYFQLRDKLSRGRSKVETILVANFLDAAAGKVPLEAAAQNVAGLVAYANAPVGAALPEGMEDWPAVRAQNGHPAPFGAEYLQIGNEIWIGRFREAVREGKGLSEPGAIAQWYLQCLKAYIAAIDAVDPTIALILDGRMGDDIEKTVLADETIRNRVEYVTFHDYAPGPINEVLREGIAVSKDDLSSLDWWQAWVAMPGQFSAEEGVNLGVGVGEASPEENRTDFVRSLGYKVAITEWNWNGWGFDDIELDDEIDWRLAAGIGTAGYLNGLMRQGNEVEMACQSLLVGANWDITSIRIDPDEDDPPYFWPQGQMTSFYSNYHGSQLLEVASKNVPSYPQPYKVGWSNTPRGDIAAIDLVATADKERLYIHAINRSLNQTIPITLDLSSFSNLGDSAEQHMFAKRRNASWKEAIWNRIRFLWYSPPQEVAEITSQTLAISKETSEVDLPAQSVSIFAIPI